MSSYVQSLLQRIRRNVIRTVATVTVTIVLEVTTHLPSQGRSSDLYHTITDEWITPLMRRWLDPEGTIYLYDVCI